jgi:hypothetical protein
MKLPICIGDEFTVDFMINRNGGKPVCRIEGMIGFIDKSVKDFVTPSSSWVVAVTGIADTFLWVKPLLKVRTPKENQAILAEKTEELKRKSEKMFPFNKHLKTKSGFQYLSFAELKAEREIAL